MATEVEAKFLASGTDVLERLAAAKRIGPALLERPRTVDETDRYLDTADGALAAARWACRLRARGGRTTVSLKGPATAADGSWLHRRPEVEGPATDTLDPAGWPPSEARDLLDRLRRGGSLVVRFTLRQRRTERAVVLDGSPVGTLSIDGVAVERDGRVHGRFDAVELELAGAGDADETTLRDLAQVLAADPDLAPDPHTKLEHALGLLPG